MGIENIAREPKISCNQSVMKSPERCVRLLCEKHRHTCQRQPMSANVSKCEHLERPPLVGNEATGVRVRRQRGRGRICRTRGPFLSAYE